METESDKTVSAENKFQDQSQSSKSKRGFRFKREDMRKPLDIPCHRTINVRMRYGGHLQNFDCGDLNVDIGDWVVIKIDDIVRLAMTTSRPMIWPADQGSRQVYLPLDRQLLRVATSEDLAQQAENQLKEREGFEYCLSRIAVQGLEMKLVAVEVAFDNFKSIYYYTADERVDFRQLVKELVNRFRTRIEMRQIGVRHEARLVGGIGMCGRDFCCASFLSNFAPVSVRMAKEQNLSLNPGKISGVCGRLMCCLAFENYSAECDRDFHRSKDGDEAVLAEASVEEALAEAGVEPGEDLVTCSSLAVKPQKPLEFQDKSHRKDSEEDFINRDLETKGDISDPSSVTEKERLEDSVKIDASDEGDPTGNDSGGVDRI